MQRLSPIDNPAKRYRKPKHMRVDPLRRENMDIEQPEKRTTAIGEQWNPLEIEWNQRGNYDLNIDNAGNVTHVLIKDTRSVVSLMMPATIASKRRRLIDLSPQMAENLRLWLESQKETIAALLQDKESEP